MSSQDFNLGSADLDGKDVLKAMAAEFAALKNQVKDLKAWKESHMEIQQGSTFSSPISIANAQASPVFSSPSYQTPQVDAEKAKFELFQSGKLNNAAMAIIHQTMSARDWQSGDLDDCPNLLSRINCVSHYLNQCRRKKGEPVLCTDGSTCETFLLLFRKFFVEKHPLTPAQGKELQRVLKRMFTKRDETECGDLVRLDPARKEFTAFIGDVCLGKLVNPKVPRMTGATAHDYYHRIEKIAKNIREIFFGSSDELVFQCLKEDGSLRILNLPTIEDLQKEIKDKLSDKEGSEAKYINKWLKAFDFYVQLRNSDAQIPEDRSHELSRDIIESWRENKKLRGYVTAVPDSGTLEEDMPTNKRKRPHGKGQVLNSSQLSAPAFASTPPPPQNTVVLTAALDDPFNAAESLFDGVMDDEFGEYAQPAAKIPKNLVAKSHSLQVTQIAFSNKFRSYEEQRDSGDEGDDDRRFDLEEDDQEGRDFDGGGGGGEGFSISDFGSQNEV